jgi:hypothetical protein
MGKVSNDDAGRNDLCQFCPLLVRIVADARAGLQHQSASGYAVTELPMVRVPGWFEQIGTHPAHERSAYARERFANCGVAIVVPAHRQVGDGSRDAAGGHVFCGVCHVLLLAELLQSGKLSPKTRTAFRYCSHSASSLPEHI